MSESYYQTYSEKYKKCKSKKDYKKLCKDMIYFYKVIDEIDANQWKIFTTMLGSDTYAKGVALAIKMYLLEQQGIQCDVLPTARSEVPFDFTDDFHDFGTYDDFEG